MTEKYKPWEGKRFKFIEDRLINYFTEDVFGRDYADGSNTAYQSILDALKKDWNEEGKNEN